MESCDYFFNNILLSFLEKNTDTLDLSQENYTKYIKNSSIKDNTQIGGSKDLPWHRIIDFYNRDHNKGYDNIYKLKKNEARQIYIDNYTKKDAIFNFFPNANFLNKDFNYDKKDRNKTHPLKISGDRIDCTQPHLIDNDGKVKPNIQFIPYSFNVAKQQLSNEEFKNEFKKRNWRYSSNDYSECEVIMPPNYDKDSLLLYYLNAEKLESGNFKHLGLGAWNKGIPLSDDAINKMKKTKKKTRHLRTGINNKLSQKIILIKDEKEYPFDSVGEAARWLMNTKQCSALKLHTPVGNLSNCANGKSHTAYGYKCKFIK